MKAANVRPVTTARDGCGGSVDDPWPAVRIRFRQWRPGPVALVKLAVMLSFVVPARLVLKGPLGAAGRPSLVVGLIVLVVWLLRFLQPASPRPFQPTRAFLMCYVVTWVGSVAVAYLRGLSPVEVAGIDRYFLITLSLSGLALATADLVRNRAELDSLLRTVAYGAALMSVVGIIQFNLGINVVEGLRLPGMRLNGELAGVAERGGPGFTRAVGTAQHSIEFGVLLAMALPLAIHYALRAPRGRLRNLRWALAGVVAVGIPMSLARSAIIALVVVLIVLLRSWNDRTKATALVVIGAGTTMLYGSIPGLIGTFISFFRNAQTDRSVAGRTQDYATVSELFQQRPLLGLGGGAFRPEQYFILDNYLLNALLSTGLLGLLSLLVMVLGSYSIASAVYRRPGHAEDRHLAAALAASILAGFVSSATFDSLNFPSFAALLFVLVGATGALWRLTGTLEVPSDQSPFHRVVKVPSDAWPRTFAHVRSG
ncbi:MAG: O-antigen ligase family protein [Acidimicrobiia bacterium]